MHFTTTALMAVASLVTISSACQCVSESGVVNEVFTGEVCNRACGSDHPGVMNGNDCEASSISECLTDFTTYCAEGGFQSTCFKD
ncbi:hypothetical protein G7046_g5919 [Stylonectria norvegica]|nr:hypothetical protein G7046_g5919 [Stylonectria norvegica]